MDQPGYDAHTHIPGTTIFDGAQAMKGYVLNKMCFSFNSTDNREAFKGDAEAYMEKLGLNEAQKNAIRSSNILAMIAEGGNIYYLAKLAGIFKLSVLDVGGLQTGMTTKEFKEFLASQAQGDRTMATIPGRITTSHIPAVGNAIANELFEDPYWKPFFDGYPKVHEWLAANKPDYVINIYNDHGLGFFLDRMPTFAVGAAHEYRNEDEDEDEDWGLPSLPPFPGAPELSWHIIESMVADEFDITSCQELPVDHGFVVPMQLFWPGAPNNADMPKAVPISANTVQHPIPTLKRVLDFGRSLRKALESFTEDAKIVVLGTGGLSHQLDGERAGFINREFDEYCLNNIVHNPDELTKISRMKLVEKAGAQGTEFLMWMMMRGALGDTVTEVNRNYHIPVSNTGAGTLLLECA